jgi:membrane protein
VAALRRVLARYDAAGGGLLAGGLAYSALFAIVPAALLATGLIGFVVSDPAARADAVEFIAAVLPPLHDVVAAALAEAGRDAGAFGLVGAATLAWGASRFVVAFSDAIARVTGRGRRRGAIARNLGAIGAVLLLPLVIVAGATLAGLLSFLGLAESRGVVALIGDALQVALGFVPVLATTLVMGLVYRVVPTPMSSWRALVPPAIVVGIVQAVLLQLFVYLAPRLIGTAALLGTIAAVFAALAWLSLSFQAILLGAAWVGERDTPSG